MGHKFYRSLCRVISIHEHFVVIVVPGWNTEIEFPVWKSVFPVPMLEMLQPGIRFLAQVSLGADGVEDMQVTGVESL